jgi:putative transposase
MTILNQAQAGTPVPALCREHGMSSATFYKWRTKYGEMDTSLSTRLKEIDAENSRLKKMYADVQLDALILRESLPKKW